jgi:hypothetical protein
MAPNTVKFPIRLKDGTLLTKKLLREIVAEAEAGAEPGTGAVRSRQAGRPSLGAEGVSPRVQFRAPAGVYAQAQARARAERRTVSSVMRELLADYAEGKV